MRALKTAGAFVRPDSITWYSKWPKDDKCFKANLVNIWAPSRQPRAESMSGRGYLFLTVIFFRPQ